MLSPCTAHTIRNLILDRIDKLSDTPADLDELRRLISSAQQLGMESLAEIIKKKLQNKTL